MDQKKVKDHLKIKKGMVFTIEPMVNLGEYHTKVLQDGWTWDWQNIS